MVTQEEVFTALKAVIDPELGLDIVNLGLVYEVLIDAEQNVHVKMSLTTPFCPAGPQILNQSEDAVRALPGIKSGKVELVFTPPWTPDKMSAEAKAALGFGDAPAGEQPPKPSEASPAPAP